MGNDPLPAAATAPSMTVLLHPTTLILVAANAVPIIGVLYWQWDAFLLHMLYWLESAIIGFWTMARIVASAPGSMSALLINGHPATKSPLRRCHRQHIRIACAAGHPDRSQDRRGRVPAPRHRFRRSGETIRRRIGVCANIAAEPVGRRLIRLHGHAQGLRDRLC
jgi:hypothetical protein